MQAANRPAAAVGNHVPCRETTVFGLGTKLVGVMRIEQSDDATELPVSIPAFTRHDVIGVRHFALVGMEFAQFLTQEHFAESLQFVLERRSHVFVSRGWVSPSPTFRQL
jgi:hypothetical protein